MHGWVQLAPNHWDQRAAALRRTEQLSSGRVVLLGITGRGSSDAPAIQVDVAWADQLGPLTAHERREITRSAKRMLRLDEDFSAFYARCRRRGRRWAPLAAGLGRLLRSPTVFEDVVKTICTTNTQWGGTRRMVEGLVQQFGAAYDGGDSRRSFPAPEAIASVPLEEFVSRVRLGYRGPYVHRLAERVASGELDLEALRDDGIPTAELKSRLLAVKGVGNYGAATLLMLLGRYDEIAIDSVFRQFVAKRHFAGRRPADEEARTIYQSWGRWKYLAYWFELWDAYPGKLA
jgi:3-methyladenine DNA glycosylase/8-oxoguanine DNA glycosylase